MVDSRVEMMQRWSARALRRLKPVCLVGSETLHHLAGLDERHTAFFRGSGRHREEGRIQQNGEEEENKSSVSVGPSALC